MTLTDHTVRQRTLAEYLAILRRRKWVAVLPVVLVPLVAYVYSVQQPAVYSASADVLLSRQDLSSSLSGATNPDIYTDPDRFAQTQAALARVPTVAKRAVASAKDAGATPGELLLSSSVTPLGNADLLRFSVRNESPAAAAVLVTAYATAFASYRRELDTTSLANARKDLQRSIDRLGQSGASGTALYRELTKKVQELRTMELLQGRAEVVREADTGVQVAPTPRRNAMLGVGLGLLLGLSAIFLWEALDRRVRDEDEIQRVLGQPLLARLPEPKKKGLVMLDDPSDVDAEAVRRLRTSVEFANLDVNAKVIMVTSAVSEEGKTTTIANLAIALARAGSRVALVDLDLRKPTIGRLFGLELRAGLADVAIERVELDTALFNAPLRADGPVRLSRRTTSGRARQDLRPITEGQLYVLPAGFIPASPGELVGTTAVGGILASLREQMDFVLVDAPPMLTVSDAATLSRRADAIVIVARLGVVNRPMLRDLARAVDATPARTLGFILTGAGATESYDVGAYSYQTKRSSSEDVPRATAATDAAPEIRDDEDWPAYGDRRTTPGGR